MAVDEGIHGVDHVDVIGVAVHLGERVETFHGGAVSAVGGQAGGLGRSGHHRGVLRVTLGEQLEEACRLGLQPRHPSVDMDGGEAVRGDLVRGDLVGRFRVRYAVESLQLLYQVMQHARLLQIRQGGGVAVFLQYDAGLPGHLGDGGVEESLHGGYLVVQSPVKLVADRVLGYDGLAEYVLAAALFQCLVERVVGGLVGLLGWDEFRVLAFGSLRRGYLVEAEGFFLART